MADHSLTSDSTSILEALEIYARKVHPGFWMLRDEIKQRIRSHSEIIALLALIGKSRGYDIWIGSPEQGAVAEGLAGTIPLRNLVTNKPTSLKNVQNLKDVLLMDLLWIKNGAVQTAFEVESTTTMTSGLQRGSNLLPDVRKVMVIPEERKVDFDRKMQSPLFSEAYSTQNWNLLFFDRFRDAYSTHKDKVSIEDILGVPSNSKEKGNKATTAQGSLEFA